MKARTKVMGFVVSTRRIHGAGGGLMGLAFWLFVPIGVLAVVVRVVESTTAKSVLVGVQLTLLAVQVYALLRSIRKDR